MNRTWITLFTAAMVAVGSVGCAGNAPSGFAGEEAPGLNPDLVTLRGYLGVTNRVMLGSEAPTSVNIDLVAGARVQLEVAAVDGEELKFQIFHTRAEGSTELVNPVKASSGFKVTTLEAPSEGRFSLAFPKSKGEREIVVWMECEGGVGRCAVKLQPGERCHRGLSCDEGLDCKSERGECDPIKVLGMCIIRDRSNACSSETPK